MGVTHLQHASEGDRVGTALEEEWENPLENLVRVHHIFPPVSIRV